MIHLSIYLLLALFSGMHGPTGRFVLRGNVPGVADSTEISLTFSGNENRKITGYVIGEKFELQGQADTPICCNLYVRGRAIDFFVESGELIFTTPHVDSLPLPKRSMMYDLRKEKNYSVTGSGAQDVFYAYQQQTVGLRYDLGRLHEKSKGAKNEENYKRWYEIRQEFERVTWELMKRYQNLAVNLYLVEELKKAPFTYDRAYLDDLKGLFTPYHDTCAALRDFLEYIEKAKAYTMGTVLEDGELITSDGKTVSLYDQLNKEGYTVIDFWASYCGPCLARFPHLRKLHKQYEGKVKFVSLSKDNNEAEWKSVMEKENLPWDEFLCGKQLSKAYCMRFNVTFIPLYLIISPDRKIVFSSDHTGALALALETLLSEK